MRPKLRELAIEAVDDGYAVSDPHGLSPHTLWLSQPAMFLASLLDGSRTLAELQVHLHSAHAARVAMEALEELVQGLETAGFLESPETAERMRAIEAAYLAQPARPMPLAGACYPAAEADFRDWVDLCRGVAPPWPPAAPLRGLVMPHLDPRRVPGLYGAAIEALAQTPPPARVLVVGVAHSAIREDAAALPLAQATPLGTVPVDTEALDALAARLPFPLYNSPLAFREEHSIEFPIAFLKAAWPQANVSVLPLVLRGNDDAEAIGAIAVAIADLQAEYPFLPVASVDLSHVGARFDDPPLGRDMAQETQAIDRGYLDRLAAGDFDRAFRDVTEAGNPTRIDATASVQALSRVLVGTGTVLAYELSAELESLSAVGAGVVAYR
ncbi:MAG: AmmeMemoRadiSam system protein B [Candidatus Sericytochromatia bacterium]